MAATGGLARVLEAIGRARRGSTDRVVEFGPGDADPRVLVALAAACRAARLVRFGYVAADGAATIRLVEPHRLVALHRRWYLVAYDRDRRHWRSFRVDRLSAPRAGARSRRRPPPPGGAVEYVRAAVERRSAGEPVLMRVAAPPARVREVVGKWASVTADGDGAVVRMRTRSPHWPLIALAELGAPASVAPAELAERAREWATTLRDVRSADRGDR